MPSSAGSRTVRVHRSLAAARRRASIAFLMLASEWYLPPSNSSEATAWNLQSGVSAILTPLCSATTLSPGSAAPNRVGSDVESSIGDFSSLRRLAPGR